MSRNENGKGFSLKDELFNEAKVRMLGERFAAVYVAFDVEAFVLEIMRSLLRLELKERIGHITTVLATQLPEDFDRAAGVIVEALPAPLDPTKTDNDFGDFIYAPLGEYVVRHGCTIEHLSAALSTLREITKRFSMEDAIRAFLNAYPKETLQELNDWTQDAHYHVRRLVSEGTRPLLPWSGRIGIDQEDTLPLLNALYGDTTRYVTRSVANHLNDIAKEKPQLVVEILARWQQEGRQAQEELAWMTRHALRTLVKQGNSEALELLGYSTDPRIAVSASIVSYDSVHVGEALEFSCTITALRDELLMVDYVIDFVKANGKRAQKVYKLKKLHLQKGEVVTLIKKHRFYKDATTLTFYPGEHTLTLQINGQRFDTCSFDLQL